MTRAARALVAPLTAVAVVFASVAFAAFAAPVAAPAQTYPNRPVKIIVPTPAGGPVDVMARLFANALPAFIGQNAIVENRAGAGNTLGSKAAAADPDGYTLLVSAASGLIMSPMVYKTAGYDETNVTPTRLTEPSPTALLENYGPTEHALCTSQSRVLPDPWLNGTVAGPRE